MSYLARPFRSVLYIPGARERALDKARGLAADAIIFDLEDAVGPDEKPAARACVAQALSQGGYGRRSLLVRINGFETDWWADDLTTIAAARPEAVLLPKVNAAADIERLERELAARPGMEDTVIWAMMETPQGILNAAAIARASFRMRGFVMGTNDLAKDIGTRDRSDRLPMMPALGLCLLAARAAGILCVDGVYNAFKDTEGLAAECAQGRDMGFDGKTLIHPAQLATANAAFAPSEQEIALARAQIAAFEEAEAAGKGIAVLNGRIVENLHVETARKILARAEAIAAMDAAVPAAE